MKWWTKGGRHKEKGHHALTKTRKCKKTKRMLGEKEKDKAQGNDKGGLEDLERIMQKEYVHVWTHSSNKVIINKEHYTDLRYGCFHAIQPNSSPNPFPDFCVQCALNIYTKQNVKSLIREKGLWGENKMRGESERTHLWGLIKPFFLFLFKGHVPCASSCHGCVCIH